MKFIGAPNKNDLSFLTEEPAIQYVSNVAQNCKKQDLAEKLPECDKKEMISILGWLL
jgi:hypothetical protein